MRSATEHSLRRLKAEGITAQVVEKWVPVAGNWKQGKRIDLFGIIDIIALGPKIIGIQSTTGGQHSARVRKAKAEPRLIQWLRAGGQFAVWSWTKKPHAKKDGSPGAARWKLRTQEAVLNEMGEVAFNAATWVE